MQITNVTSVALGVGSNRILPARGIPYPCGDPGLSPAAEYQWRRRLLEAALVALATPVREPTVFPVA